LRPQEKNNDRRAIDPSLFPTCRFFAFTEWKTNDFASQTSFASAKLMTPLPIGFSSAEIEAFIFHKSKEMKNLYLARLGRDTIHIPCRP
jgi:hypothetical protein